MKHKPKRPTCCKARYPIPTTTAFL